MTGMTGFERFRRKALLSRAKLAEILGVTTTAHTLKRLSTMYGVTVDELLRTDYPDNDLIEPTVKEA